MMAWWAWTGVGRQRRDFEERPGPFYALVLVSVFHCRSETYLLGGFLENAVILLV